MSDSYYITESSELNLKIRVQNILTWPCMSVTFCNFCGRLRHDVNIYSTSTYDVMKSYLTCMRDKNIGNGYITLKTSVVM